MSVGSPACSACAGGCWIIKVLNRAGLGNDWPAGPGATRTSPGQLTRSFPVVQQMRQLKDKVKELEAQAEQ